MSHCSYDTQECSRTILHNVLTTVSKQRHNNELIRKINARENLFVTLEQGDVVDHSSNLFIC